jgi:hypothetical protein
MLLDLLAVIPVRAQRWLFRLAGVSDGIHEWFDAICPCGGEHE